MDDAVLVRFLQGLRDRPRDLEGFVDGNRTPLQPLREVLGGDELPGQEVGVGASPTR